MMDLVHFIENREGVEESMCPVEEEILHKIDEQNLTEDFLEGGEGIESLLEADQRREGKDERVDKALVHDEIEDSLLEEEFPSSPLPRPS